MRKLILRTLVYLTLGGLLGCAPTLRRVAEEDRVARLKRDIGKVRFAIRTTKTLIARARGTNYLPNLYNRLAELYVEQARYHYQIALERQNKRSLGVVSVQARLLKNQAIATYRRLLALFPDFPDADKVTFFMGHEMRELGDYDKMLTTYQELSDRFPKSKYRLEALLVMGDYYFDKAQLDQAERYYQLVIDAPETRVHAMARYKLAWCRINRADFKGALKLFEGSISAARKWLASTGGRSSAGSKIDLRREALVDSVFCYTEVHKPDRSVRYFRKRADSKTTFLAALHKLGNRYYVKQDWKATAGVYREILALSGDVEDALEYAHRLYEAVKNGRLYDHGAADVRGLINVIRRRYYNQSLSKAQRDKLLETFEQYARDIATRLQDLANSRKTRKTYLAAAGAYKAYLQFFGDHKNASVVRANLAETLYAARQYLEAGKYYELAAKSQKAQTRKDSVYTAVVAYFEALKAKQKLTRLEIVQARGGLRRAGAVYLEEFGKKAGGDELRQVKFNIARTYYDAGELRDAIRYFTALVDQFPSSNEGPIAAHLVLDAYRSIEDYDGLIAAGKAFQRNSSLGNPQFRQEVAQIIKGAEDALLRTETIKAGDEGEGGDLSAIARKYRGTALGQKALLNEFVTARNAKDPERIFEVGEEFLRSYPQSPELSNVLATMGKIAMSSLQFDRGATYLEAAARRKKGGEGLALVKAAVAVRAGLGQRQKAERDLSLLLRGGLNSNQKAKLAVKISRLHVQANDWNSVIGLLKRASAAGASSAQMMYLLGYALFRQNQLAEAQRSLEQALALGRRGGDEDREAAAAAQFYLAELLFKTFSQIQLSSDLSQLGPTLQQKLTYLAQTRATYKSVVSIGSAVWSVAALGRLATIDEKGAAELRNLALPSGLPADAVQQVRGALESNAAPLAKEAKAAIKQCAATAQRLVVLSAAAKACLSGVAPAGDPQATGRVASISRARPQGAAKLQRRLAANPRDQEAIVALARLYLAAGDPYMARLILGKGLEINETAQLLNLVGVATARLGEEQQAFALFIRALKRNPSHVPARLNKAALLSRFGYSKKGKAERARAGRRKPPSDDVSLLPGAVVTTGGRS